MYVTLRQRKRKHASVRPCESFSGYARYCCPHQVVQGYSLRAELALKQDNGGEAYHFCRLPVSRWLPGEVVQIFQLPVIYSCCLRDPQECTRWWEDANYLLDKWSRPVTESGHGAPSNHPAWDEVRAELAAVIPWPPEAEQAYRAARAQGRQRGHDGILWASRVDGQ